MAHKKTIMIACLGVVSAIHGMHPVLSTQSDTFTLELAEAAPPTDPSRRCTELIQRQGLSSQDADAVINWLRRARPEEYAVLSQSSLFNQEITSRVLRQILAYEKERRCHASRWCKILVPYAGVATIGFLALTGVTIKVSMSC